MNSWTRIVLVAGTLLLAACGAKKKTVGLDVDVYLHATSSASADVMLQAGIESRLAASTVAQNGVVHVRVFDGVVTLSGAVKSAAIKTQAEQIARSTELTLNGVAIRGAGAIKNQIDVEP